MFNVQFCTCMAWVRISRNAHSLDRCGCAHGRLKFVRARRKLKVYSTTCSNTYSTVIIRTVPLLHVVLVLLLLLLFVAACCLSPNYCIWTCKSIKQAMLMHASSSPKFGAEQHVCCVYAYAYLNCLLLWGIRIMIMSRGRSRRMFTIGMRCYRHVLVLQINLGWIRTWSAVACWISQCCITATSWLDWLWLLCGCSCGACARAT